MALNISDGGANIVGDVSVVGSMLSKDGAVKTPNTDAIIYSGVAVNNAVLSYPADWISLDAHKTGMLRVEYTSGALNEIALIPISAGANHPFGTQLYSVLNIDGDYVRVTFNAPSIVIDTFDNGNNPQARINLVVLTY